MALVNVTFLKAYDLAQACPSPGYIDHVHHPQLIFDGKNPDLWQSSMLRRFIRTPTEAAGSNPGIRVAPMPASCPQAGARPDVSFRPGQGSADFLSTQRLQGTRLAAYRDWVNDR
eukprot:scaffold303_cov410-Prasinococcus_capsulatus_cf.AAC.13